MLYVNNTTNFFKKEKNWDIRLENHYISSFKSLTLGLKFGKMSIYQSETTKGKKKNVGDVAIRERTESEFTNRKEYLS